MFCVSRHEDLSSNNFLCNLCFVFSQIFVWFTIEGEDLFSNKV